jgi:outer membrane receptor for ferrienterochelin and colicins
VTRIFLVAALLAATALGSAAQTTRSITGVVRDGTGLVVAGATVIARGGAIERLTDTGRDGRFEVRNLADGTYAITIVAAGFAPATAEVAVPSADALEVTLTPAAVVEEVRVVSGSRQDELRDSLNTRVDVVTRARIQDTGAQTAAEVLRELPGVVTRRGSETAGAAGQQIQGIDSRQVLVLLDGQPLVGARGIKRGVVNLDRQSAARLERIEVVKGASSALYGSDAIGGVINLITRDVSAPVETSGELSAGSFDEVNAVVEGGFRRGPWSGLFTVERHQQDGFDLTPTTWDTTGAPFERTDFLGRARYQFSPSASLSVLANGYDNATRGRSNGELGPQEDEIKDSTVNVNTTFDWLPRPSTTVQSRVYIARYDESSTAMLAPPVSTPLEPGMLDERVTKIDANFSQIIGSRQQLQGGAEYWRDEYRGINRLRDDSGESASMGTGWLQYRLTFSDRVTTTLGSRVDTHSQFGTAVSPKVAVNARVGNGVTTRASYGRGFRAPDIGQLYYRFMNPTNFYQVIGNPNLEPEYANSLQIGGEYATPGRRARFGVNVFRNDVNDLIESVSLGMVVTEAQLDALLAREGLDPTFRPTLGRLLFTYKNINDAVTEGVEVDGDLAVLRNLSLGGAYTYLDARDDETGLKLTGRHQHQGNIRLAWHLDRTGTRATFRGMFYGDWIAARATTATGVEDTTAPGFDLWDVFVSQRVVRGINAFVAVDNLFDNQDPNTGVLTAAGSPASIYRPEAGRTARFGVRWVWTR